MAVAQAVLDDGGFQALPRLIFGALALAGLGAACLRDRASAARAAREPVILTLWLLGILGAVSAAWTVGASGAALRWGLVSGGYGAVALAAWVLARHHGGVRIASVLIVVLAAISGAIGLVGASAFTGPFAAYNAGYWRPGGTLEYSAALGLLQVSALPAILTAMADRRRLVSCPAALAGAIAAAVLALSHSRLECAFAVLICAAAVVAPLRTVRAPRETVAGALVLLGAVALGAYLIAGGPVAPDASVHLLARLGGITALCAVATAAWGLIRIQSPHARPWTAHPSRPFAAILGALALAAAVTALASIAGSTSGHAIEFAPGGFLHGRAGLWQAALETARTDLLGGHGADSFMVATEAHQSGEMIRYAHDLPLELAVELGIPGLLLGCALYASGLLAAWRSRFKAAAWLLLPASVCFLVANLLDWEWHLAGSGAIWALALGALLGCRPAERAHAEPTRDPYARRYV